MIKITWREIGFPTVVAFCMALAGIYSMAYVQSLGPDCTRWLIALVAFGPQLMLAGWVANLIRPGSKVGWLLTAYGFNFACGLPLMFFKPMRLYFEDPLDNGPILLFMLLIITLNSFQIFYHLERSLRYAEIKAKYARPIDQARYFFGGGRWP